MRQVVSALFLLTAQPWYLWYGGGSKEHDWTYRQLSVGGTAKVAGIAESSATKMCDRASGRTATAPRGPTA